MKKEATPKLNEDKYNCPHCGTYCPQYHYGLRRMVFDLTPSINTREYDPEIRIGDGGEMLLTKTKFAMTTCAECEDFTLWVEEEMVYPVVTSLPKPLQDMPEEVKKLYIEAANVYPISAKSASALLRLAIELLLKQLGEKGSLNDKIKSLVSKGVSQKIKQGLDAVRWYGNNGIHPGEINLEERREDIIFLFYLLNIIVQELITDGKEAEKFYQRLPSKFLESVAKRDQKEKL